LFFYNFFPQPKFASQEEVLLGLKTKLEFDEVVIQTPDLQHKISLKEFKQLQPKTRAKYHVKIVAHEAITPPLPRGPLRRSG
jgi:hypothetical protein